MTERLVGAQEDPLVDAARKGDLVAFERLYHREHGRIHALVRRLEGRAAEDLVQDVFVRAFLSLKSFRGESRFSSWLHRLAINVVLQHRRRQKAPPLELVEAEAPARAPGDAIDLERAIAGLPEGARTVLVLFDIEGYRHDEIAELCGVTTGTSKAQLHRARALLREVLG